MRIQAANKVMTCWLALLKSAVDAAMRYERGERDFAIQVEAHHRNKARNFLKQCLHEKKGINEAFCNYAIMIQQTHINWMPCGGSLIFMNVQACIRVVLRVYEAFCE